MNTDNLFQTLQQSFWITVGATASLVETLQNPLKQTSNWSEFPTQWHERAQEWAEKGKITEQEARQLIDQLFSQQTTNNSSNSSSNVNRLESSPTLTGKTNEELEIEELTAQLIALRSQIEQLRQSSD